MISFFILTLLQGLVIGIDEFWCHWRRGLPKWERWGHPIDSVSLLVPLSLICFASPTPLNTRLYIGLGALSCICITKDEWVHHAVSDAFENWLHSLLFILHPLILVNAYFLWSAPLPPELFGVNVVLVSFFAVLAFTVYQITFWSLYADKLFGSRYADRQ